MIKNADIVLTGIKPTGTCHIGNYLGMMKPTLEMAATTKNCFCFIADFHALNSVHDPILLRELTTKIAASWLAMGLDPEHVVFYRNSDIPEICELHWILSSVVPLGLLEQSHAFKASVEKNLESGKDRVQGINFGVYSYPVLMAADILLFNTKKVPVGKDQVQHVETARDIARRFNLRYGEVFEMPEYSLQKDVEIIPGLDGRKMSKSYDNTIPLFETPKKLKKIIGHIQTDSTPVDAPKDPTTSTIFHLYRCFATDEETEAFKKRYQEGISWGDAKGALFELINHQLEEPRARYNALLENKEKIDQILTDGAKKARSIATSRLETIKRAVGLL